MAQMPAGFNHLRRDAAREFLSVRPVPLYMENRQLRIHALALSVTGDVYRYAFWLCRDRSYAEDLVQKTSLRAWRSQGSLRDQEVAKTWLFTVVSREHGRCFDRVRP